jgi:hypothetical protein
VFFFLGFLVSFFFSSCFFVSLFPCFFVSCHFLAIRNLHGSYFHLAVCTKYTARDLIENTAETSVQKVIVFIIFLLMVLHYKKVISGTF